MTIGQKIKARRKELHMTADTLAARIGKNRATVYRYENESIEKLPANILHEIASALQVTPEYLMGWDEKIGSGLSFENLLQAPAVSGEESGAQLTSQALRADFCHVVRDDSLLHLHIPKNAVLFFRSCDSVANGDLVCARVHGETRIRRFFSYGDTVVLRPAHPDFAETVLTAPKADDFEICGKALYCLSGVPDFA